MKKKIPSIYANKINKNIGNNNQVYYSGKKEQEEKKEEKNISQKINDIFTSKNYVYKANVKIKLKDKTITKKIIGKNALHLITIDNELIPISDILDIQNI